LVSTEAALYASPRVGAHDARQVTLLDLLDRLLAGGVVLLAQIRLAVADIDLVDLDLALLLSSAERLLEQ
jgi:hypothetical protein